MRRCHCQNGRPAAYVRNRSRPHPVINQPIESLQTAQRRSMVTGPKRHCGLDAQAYLVARYFICIVCAVDEKPPGLDRRQLAPNMGHPIGLWHFRHGK